MLYCAASDLVAGYGQDAVTRLSVSDSDPDGSVTTASAIAYASALIDAQLSVRFALPLDVVPQILIDVAVDLAIDRMANSADLATEIVLDRARRARADLKAIAQGHMNLGLPPLVAGESPRPVLARQYHGLDKLMTRHDLRGV